MSWYEKIEATIPFGWREMVFSTIGKIHLILDEYTNGGKLVIEDIKEKLGSLRFYYRIEGTYPNEIGDMIDILVDHIEYRSTFTCEDCGNFGQTIDEGRVNTLCTDCYNKRWENRKQKFRC